MNDPAMRRPRRRKRLVLAASVAVLLALIAISIAVAQGDLGGKLRSGREVSVPAGETVATDLYVAAGTVTVDGTVQGDLVVTGGWLTLNGSVDGDVLAAGGTIRVGGTVAGDVRAAGGQVVVSGAVGEDGVLTGGQVELAAGGTIGEDLIVAGGQVTVAGDVTGSVTGTAGTYSRTGQVGGSDDVQIRQMQSPFDRTPDLAGDAIRHYLSVLLVGILALWLAPRFVAVAEGTIRRRPLTAAGWGLGGFLAFFALLIVIPLVTVLVALVLGVIGFLGLLGFELLAGIVAVLGLILAFGLAGFFLGDAILGLALALLVAPDRGGPATRTAAAGGIVPPAPIQRGSMLTGRNVLLMAIGVAVVVILTSVPVIGGILRFVFAVLALGAVLFALWWSRDRGQGQTVTMETAVG